MKTYTLLFLVLTTIVSSVSAQTLFQFRHLALQKVEKEELSTLIRSYQAVSLNPKTVASICAKGNCSFTLKTPDRVWNITLEENNLLSPGYQMAVNGKSITEKGSTVKTYKGYIGANPDNYVRLTIGDNFLDGYLKIDSTLLFIKPIKHILPNYKGINQFLLFNSTDIINNPSVSDCGVLSSTKKLGDQINAQNTNTLQSNSNACHFLEIATEADFEFYQFRGSNVTTANNSILSELNQVEGLYESTFNMSFVVSFQNVWTTSNDPYSTTSSMADILSELITKWQNDFSYVQRDYVHYFSGKTSLNQRGIAATGSAGRICEVASGTYAITAANVTNINIANTTAHEVAHLFNADHAGTTCSTLMCTLNPSTGPDYRSFSFAQATIDEINNWISSNGNCLDYPIEISGNSTLCTSNKTYAIVNPAGTTISWSVSPASLFAVDIGSGSSFTTRASNNFVKGAGIITATVSGDCGFTVTKPVWVGKPSSFTTNPSGVPAVQASLGSWVVIRVYSTPGASLSSLNWWTNNSSALDLNIGSGNCSVECQQTGYNYVYVTSSNACGTSAARQIPINVTSGGGGGGMFSVMPNPSSSYIDIELPFNLEKRKGEKVELTIFNDKSFLVYSKTYAQSSFKINTQTLPEGLYYLQVVYKENLYTKQILIKR